MASDSIVIKGAREHNLKNVDVTIPRDKLVVITGLSGSGKSSLAFDTIYAEGQRRYVESLSAYARQFLGQMNKPDLDSIDGLSPAVAIDQKTTSKNPRSTVGTTTEIYDYLRLLFARVGTPHCPECGREIKARTTDQVTDEILALGEGKKALILAPVVVGRKGEHTKILSDLQKEGFSRVRIDGVVQRLEGEPVKLDKKFKHTIDVVVDRVVLKASATSRIAESVETATKLSDGRVVCHLVDEEVQEADGQKSTPGFTTVWPGDHFYSLALACPEHGHSMDELQPRDFSFNAPYGACPDCAGLGSREEVDPSLLIPDPSLSLNEGCIAPFATGNYYPQVLRAVCKHMGEDPATPWEDLKKKTRDVPLYGLKSEKVFVDYVTVDGRETGWSIDWEGACEAVMGRYKDSTSDSQREKYEKYFATIPCASCGGKRLKPEILAVTVGGKNIHEVCDMSAADALEFFSNLQLDERQAFIAAAIVKEVRARLQFFVDVGLDYLTLERGTASRCRAVRLSAFAWPRRLVLASWACCTFWTSRPSACISATTSASSPRLNACAIWVTRLSSWSMTKIPFATPTTLSIWALVRASRAVTWLQRALLMKWRAPKGASRPPTCRAAAASRCLRLAASPNRGAIKLTGACENNLKNVSVSVELGTLTVVTGVSGSGKSSLITDTLAPALANRINHARHRTGEYRKLTGYEALDKIVDIDQSPIGRTPRSNPATYIGLWDDIRALFASTPEAKARGYAPGRFASM